MEGENLGKCKGYDAVYKTGGTNGVGYVGNDSQKCQEVRRVRSLLLK
jgi:hypothetical protein